MVWICENRNDSVRSLCPISYSMVVLYIGIIKIWGFLPENPYKPAYHNFVTAWHQQIFLLTIWLIIWLMPSDKHNSITAKGMGLISSLFNVTLSRDVPFYQLLQFPCSHHGSTKAYLCSPLFLSPLLHRWQIAVAPLYGFVEDLVTAVIAEVFNLLYFCLKRSVKC